MWLGRREWNGLKKAGKGTECAVVRAHNTVWNNKAGIGRSRVDGAQRQSCSQLGGMGWAVGSYAGFRKRVWLLCGPRKANAGKEMASRRWRGQARREEGMD